jgi:hypothetical protein
VFAKRFGIAGETNKNASAKRIKTNFIFFLLKIILYKKNNTKKIDKNTELNGWVNIINEKKIELKIICFLIRL